jgi:hypothetical protein
METATMRTNPIPEKIQKQLIRAVVKRKAASDITTRPIKLGRCELLSIEDEGLQEKDLKNLTMTIII